ncbi:hypothetical protein BGX28_005350 [Mortierella sp. GBA30]|nr:hypothetical protein BGX28_005350 [Mortierella sp. GBA30]
MTILDTRASMGSNSIMSQTRRISDQKMWQRQMDIQRDLAKQSESPTLSPLDFQESQKPNIRTSEKNNDKGKDEYNGSNSNSNGEEAAGNIPRTSLSSSSSFRKSSHRNSSLRLSFHESTSRTSLEDHQQPGVISPTEPYIKTHGRDQRTDKGLLSRKHVQQVLSAPNFIPNPRGIAPTPSPDASVVLAQASLTRVGDVDEKVSNDELVKKSRKRMESYEEQLDQRLKEIQANNGRLRDLKSLWEIGRRQDGVLALQDREQDEYDSGDDVDEEDDEDYDDNTLWSLEQDRQKREEAFNMLLAQNQNIRLELEEMVRECAKHRVMEDQIEIMSIQLRELVEMGESQSKDLDLARGQAAQDRDQWERQLSDERAKQHQLQLTLNDALARREGELAEEIARGRAEDHVEHKKLIAEVELLNHHVQDLKCQIQDQETQARVTVTKQEDQERQYHARIRSLKRQLDDEQVRQTKDQEALAETVGRKEEDLYQLRSLLDERRDLLNRREDELFEARALIKSLQNQFGEQQEESLQSHKQEQERQKRELRQQQAELKDVKKELAQERESSHQLHILLESRQETCQVQESKIRELEEEIDRRALELSKTNSTSSSVMATAQAQAETIQELRMQIEDQEHILQEKEDRIQKLEQELAQAKEEDHREIAYLEQDVEELRGECSKMADLLDDERLKVEELQSQLQHKDQELCEELEHRLEKERRLLRQVISELESAVAEKDLAGGRFCGLDVTEEREFQEQRRELQEQTRKILEGAETEKQQLVHLFESIRAKSRERHELLKERSCQEHTIADQQRRLDACDAELDVQQERLLTLEEERKQFVEQFDQLQEDLDIAKDEQRTLRQQLQEKSSQLREDAKERTRQEHFRASLSRRRAVEAESEAMASFQSKIRSLEDHISTLQQEKAEATEQLAFAQEQIQTMDETIQDQTEAAKAIRAKYTEKMKALQAEFLKQRQMVVSQEGTLFLYLSIIEKLKLELRGTKVE